MSSRAGATIVEIVIAFGLAAILLPALFTGIYATQSGKAQQIQRLGALNLLKQEEEAVRNFREKNWENFAALDNGNSLHVQPSGPTWSLASLADSTTAPGYHQWVTINKYSRGGNDDPSTKKVDLFVSWDSPIPSQVTSTMYLTRYVSNNFFMDTTVPDFQKTGSVFSGTVAVAPGQVTLVNQPSGADWCGPGGPTAQLNLSGGAEARSVVAGIGRAFVGTGRSSNGKAYYNVTVNNDVNPPAPAEAGVYDYPQSSSKTNGVFGESHYAYLATDTNSAEVVILDVTPNIPTLVGTINTPGPNDANSVFVSNNILYVTTDNDKLYTYDITNRASPVARGQITLAGNGKKIYVVGSYVYVALGSTSNQLQIINASNPSSLVSTAVLKVNDHNGVDVFVKADASRAYLVTELSAQNDFFIINTTNPSSPAVLGTGYNTAPMDPQGITVIDNRGIIVGFNRPQYQVFRVESDAYDRCAFLPRVGDPDIDNIYNVSSVYVTSATGTHAYSYIVTANAGNEFQIIEGGSGGVGGYVSSGTYESGASWPALPMPTTANTAFNHFNVTYVKPDHTDIKLQVSVVDAPGGVCAGASYVGPGQPPVTGNFSTGAGNGFNPVTQTFPIPFGTNLSGYQNPGKCFRYKTILTTTDSTMAPALDEITVNYSP